MLMNVAFSISRYLHVDPSSSIAVKVVRIESIIARDLVSSRQATKIHPYNDVYTRDREVPFSTMAIS